jgi:methylenetetrahydrofolate dehydrogenase (NADP+)/methenyltetrahydrofolate cyclohydrolase
VHYTTGSAGVILEVDKETGKMKTYGDVDAEAAKEKVAAITPVPGGVGVVTTAILLRNTLEAVKWQGEG